MGNLSRGLNAFQGFFEGTLPPGLNIGSQLGRIAGEAFARRFLINNQRQEQGPQTIPVPATPPDPIATGGGLYKLVVNTVWADPSANAQLGGTFYVQVWGPVYFIQPNNAGQRGPEATGAGATMLAHGNSFYSSEQFNSPGPRSGDPIWANIGGGTSDESKQVTITYRIWPASLPDPQTPFQPLPVGSNALLPSRPVTPFAPYPPPHSQRGLDNPVQFAPPSFPVPILPAPPTARNPGDPSQVPRPPSSPQPQRPSSPQTSPPAFDVPAPARSPARSPGLSSTPNPPFEDDPVASCRFRDDPFSAETRQQAILANQKLDNLLGLLGDSAIMGKLNSIDNKLGPQLSGGIGGVLKNFARSNMVQSFLNALTFITALHNALMLSNSVRQTLFSAFDIIYQLPGMQQFAPRDPETGEVVDYGTWASDQFDTLLRSAFGDQTVDTVRNSWNRASRIYQAASNLLFSIQSIMWSLQEALEIVGNYVAKIGNALRKFGVVTERAYSWMNPQAADSRKLSRVFNAINNTSEAVENIEQVAAASLDITETAAELGRQSQAFDRALRGLNEQGEPDPNLEIPFPYGDNREPQHVAAAEGLSRETAQNFDQSIDPNDEQRQEPAQ